MACGCCSFKFLLRYIVPIVVVLGAIMSAYMKGISSGITLGSQGARELAFWRDLGQAPHRIEGTSDLPPLSEMLSSKSKKAEFSKELAIPSGVNAVISGVHGTGRKRTCDMYTPTVEKGHACSVVCNATYVDDSPAAALIPYRAVVPFAIGEDAVMKIAKDIEIHEANKKSKSNLGAKHNDDSDDDDEDDYERIANDVEDSGVERKRSTSHDNHGLPKSVLKAARRGRREIEEMLRPIGDFKVVGGATADPSIVERSIVAQARAKVIKWISWVVSLSNPLLGFLISTADKIDLWWLNNSADIVPSLLAIERKENELFLFVRGSITLAEWIHDGDSKLVNGGIHEGYSRMADALWPTLEPQIAAILRDRPSMKKITVTGHSLGAAVATLLAERAYSSFAAFESREIELSLYTYGSPRVFSQARAKEFEATTHGPANKNPLVYYRFVATFDPVCQFPVSALKDFTVTPAQAQQKEGLVYQHVGTGIEIGPYPPNPETYGCIGNVGNMAPSQVEAAVNHHCVHYIDLLENIVEPASRF